MPAPMLPAKHIGARPGWRQASTARDFQLRHHLAVHGNITALVYEPIAENIHGIDERVSLASLKRVTKALVLFAAGWCLIEP